MLINVAAFVVILGSAICQEQIFADYHKCHITNTSYSDCFNSSATGPYDYRGYADLRFFYIHAVDCSAITKFTEHHRCVSVTQRQCITDIRWYTVRPTYEQLYEALEYYCQNQIGKSFDSKCYWNNIKDINTCTELKSPTKISADFTFNQYKADYCHYLDVSDQCTIKQLTSCPNTAKIVVDLEDKLRPLACIPSGEIGQKQLVSDYNKCHLTNTYSHCFNDRLESAYDYRHYADLRAFYLHLVDCSAIKKFTKHHACVTATQRQCLTDRRWFSMRPTFEQLYEAFKYYCENQIVKSFNRECYFDNSEAINDCVKSKVSTTIPLDATFDEYKHVHCKFMDAKDQCIIKTLKTCNTTAQLVMEFRKQLKPAGCILPTTAPPHAINTGISHYISAPGYSGFWGLQCSILGLFLSLY